MCLKTEHHTVQLHTSHRTTVRCDVNRIYLPYEVQMTRIMIPQKRENSPDFLAGEEAMELSGVTKTHLIKRALACKNRKIQSKTKSEFFQMMR